VRTTQGRGIAVLSGGGLMGTTMVRLGWDGTGEVRGCSSLERGWLACGANVGERGGATGRGNSRTRDSSPTTRRKLGRSLQKKYLKHDLNFSYLNYFLIRRMVKIVSHKKE
jgi:hypothetical protein